MKRLRATLSALLALLACAAGLALHGQAHAQPQPQPPAQSATSPRADDPDTRQLLVMLPLPKAHYRPDSSYAGSYGDGVGLQARKRLAAALAQQHDLQLQAEWPMPLAEVDCFVMQLPAGDARSAAQAAQAVALDRRVAWAQPVQSYRAQATRDEPMYAAQPAAHLWHLADLHTMATGRGVRVAVIDSGIAERHPDLAGQVSRNDNFVDDVPLRPEAHGTAVAGIIAARADNQLGIAGIAPQARLLALRACWQDAAAQTLCTSLSLAKALQAAVQQDAEIVNMSLAGPDDRLLGVLLDRALARGITVVAALGSGARRFPGNHPGVVAVGAAPPLPAGAVQAPGNDVPSTTAGGGWALVSGSSFAAAHVSGLLALVRERDGSGATRPLRETLVSGAAGRVDSCATLQRPGDRGHPPCGGAALGHTAE